MSLDPRTSIGQGRASLRSSGSDSSQDIKSLQQTITTLTAEKCDSIREIKRLEQTLLDLEAKYQIANEQAKIIAQKSKETNQSHMASLDQLMKVMEGRTSAFNSQKEMWRKAEMEKDLIIKGLEDRLRSASTGPRLSTSNGEVIVLREKVSMLEAKLAETYSRKSVSETQSASEIAKLKLLLAESQSKNKELQEQREAMKYSSDSRQVIIDGLEKRLKTSDAFGAEATKTIQILEDKLATSLKSQDNVDSLKQKLFSAETNNAITIAKLQESESQRRQVMNMLKQNMDLLEGNRQSSLKVLAGLQAKVAELTEANQALQAQQRAPTANMDSSNVRAADLQEKVTRLEIENIALNQNLEILKTNLKKSDEHQQELIEKIKAKEEALTNESRATEARYIAKNSQLESERELLSTKLKEIQKDLDTSAKQMTHLELRLAESEKFEKAAIEKNLDFQTQIENLEKLHRKTLADKAKAEEAVVIELKNGIIRLERTIDKFKDDQHVLDTKIAALLKEKSKLEVEVSNLKLLLKGKNETDSKLKALEQQLAILTSEKVELNTRVEQLLEIESKLSLALAAEKKTRENKVPVGVGDSSQSLLRSNRLLKARNLLILKCLQDVESERLHALARLSNLNLLSTEELKVLTDLGLMEELEHEEGVRDFVYEFLF